MKLLDITSTSDTSQFPFKKGTLQFMQDAHRETLAATIKALIGIGYSPTVIYVMSGVLNSGTAPSYTTNAGSIFFNGEIFDIDAVNFTASGSNVAVFGIVQSQFSIDADPVTFTDFVVRNVHNIRKMQLSQGASGTGLADFSQLYRLNFNIPALLNLTAMAGTVGGTNYSDNILQVIGMYPNLGLYVPAPVNSLHPILAVGSYNIGDLVNSNINTYAVTFPTALATANYQVLGAIISNGTVSQDTTVVWSIANRLTTGFQLNAKEIVSTVQNVAFEYTIIQK